MTIPAGAASATLTVEPIDDQDVEGLEDVILTLQADPAYALGSPQSAKVQIIDNELDPITVIATDALASEAGLDSGEFTIARVGDLYLNPLTVYYTLSGSATAGVDYQNLSGSVTIPAGSLVAKVRLTPINDTTVEGPETVILTVVPRPGYKVGVPDRAIVIINDNDFLLPGLPGLPELPGLPGLP